MEDTQQKLQEYIDGITKQTSQLLNLRKDVQDIKNWISKSPQLTVKMSGIEDRVLNLGQKHDNIIQSINSIAAVVNKQDKEIIPGINKALKDANIAINDSSGALIELAKQQDFTNTKVIPGINKALSDANTSLQKVTKEVIPNLNININGLANGLNLESSQANKDAKQINIIYNAMKAHVDGAIVNGDAASGALGRWDIWGFGKHLYWCVGGVLNAAKETLNLGNLLKLRMNELNKILNDTKTRLKIT